MFYSLLERLMKIQEAKEGGVLYLVRHAKTKLNAEGEDKDKDVIRGWKDVPLDDVGVRQTQEIAKQFTNIMVDKIYSSPLTRCLETANAISEVVGAPIKSDPGLKPWNLGDFQGEKTVDVIDQIWDYAENRPDEPVEDGESFSSFIHRYIDALQKMMQEVQSGLSVVAVAHYRNIKATQAWIGAGASGYNIDMAEFKHDSVTPGSVYKITRLDGKWEIDDLLHPREVEETTTMSNISAIPRHLIDGSSKKSRSIETEEGHGEHKHFKNTKPHSNSPKPQKSVKTRSSSRAPRSGIQRASKATRCNYNKVEYLGK